MTTQKRTIERYMTRPQLSVHYWREHQLIGNLGDALVPIVLHALGYDLVSRKSFGPAIVNPRTTLLAIGSLLTEFDLKQFHTPVEVWGCGWKGASLSSTVKRQITVHAVRGPLTVAGLGLPSDTPLGDPALLLPHLLTRPVKHHGSTLVIPHFHRAGQQSVAQRQRLSECCEVLSPQVFQFQGIGHTGWLPQLRVLAKNWLRLGLWPHTAWSVVERIAGADFVLSGSLHGAILAHAYGVPWAAYDDGYIDTPAKWLDWAAYLGIQIDFVTTLTEGQFWWRSQGRHGVIRDLSPLLDAFPYPLNSDTCSSLLAGDGG